MKKIFLLFLISIVFFSCDKNQDKVYKEYVVATPLLMSVEEFRTSVDIEPPRSIENSGKIYAYKNYIFVNDKYKGIHVIDNENPKNPIKIAFLKIAGNVDIAIKNDVLYADSLMDLLIFDISEINHITMTKRLENVLQQYVNWPVEADVFDWANVYNSDAIQIGWETTTQRMLQSEYEERYGTPKGEIFIEALNAADVNAVGQGGSLARFKIVGDYFYAVDSHQINVFEISDLENPLDLEDVYAGFDIETIFHKGSHLYLGSMSGMYIYDISSPDKPVYVSEFQHGTACDPVVVDDAYAYVTLRGGNMCGATESGLYIIDLSDIQNPSLKVYYPMEEPYGLGLKDEKLFICDGTAGLKVYDKTNVEDLKLLNHFEDMGTFDVIPLQNSLLMIGDETLYQYEYRENDIQLLSTFHLD